MSEFSEILAREIALLHEDVVDTMSANDQRATGKTAAAIRSTSGAEYAGLFGPGHLAALRDGRRPGQRPPIQAIIEWLKAKRLQLNPYAVAANIAKRGTRLFRGEDPRFRKPTATFSAAVGRALPRFRQALVEASRSGLRSTLVSNLPSRL